MHDAPPFLFWQQTLIWDKSGRQLQKRLWEVGKSEEEDVSSTPIPGFSKLLATLQLTYPMLPGHKFMGEQTPLSEAYTPQGKFMELYIEEHDPQGNTVLDAIYLSHNELKKTIKLVQLETSAEEVTDFGVVFSPAANLLALSPQEQKSGRKYLQYLFDARTGKSPAGWPADLGGPIVAISPDTRQLLVEDAAKTWKVIDARNLKPLCTVPKLEKPALLLQFDPDNHGLWVGTGEQLVHFRLC